MSLLKARTGARAALGLAVMCAFLFSAIQVSALSFKKHKQPAESQQKPAETASQPPAFSIPVEPLGFTAPAAFYLGQREALVSLDFLDENRLLFTFRAPGLIHRTGPSNENERQIRALVLALPAGNIESEALWTLHGTDRYLWGLHDGHFLLRDGDTIKEGNASLELKPFLQFPGPLLWLQMDPAQQYLVTDSREPSSAKLDPHKVGSPSTAQASVTSDTDTKQGEPDIVLRVLRRSSGQVMLVSRVRSTAHLPINSDGYLETLRGNGRTWVLNLSYFTGGSHLLGRVDSICDPPVEFLSTTAAVANTCLPQGGRSLVAVSTGTAGLHLWEAPSPPTQIWPTLIPAPDGSVLARETITLDRPVDMYSNLIDSDTMRAQLVEVLDSKSGKIVLKAPASPILDAGGNVAISPSGKHVAILNAGAIQVYDLAAHGSGAPSAPEPSRP